VHIHPSRRPRFRGLALAVAASGSLLIVQLPRLSAQSEDGPYRMLLTPERALAFVQAADRKLDYIPGEVLVKFKAGVGAAGQQRALGVLRSRPALSDLRWIGDVALVTDYTEWNATILATQLRAQPEVAYAQPNHLYRTNTTPNDPGFAERQWNFAALDMERAWDLNAGASDAITVAVLDTGVTSVSRSFLFQTWNGQSIQLVNVPFARNPDLSESRIVKPRDMIFWEGPVLDMEGHGTHVASTIGEDTNNSLAEAGIAYHVKVMPVKVCLGYWEIQFALSASGFRGFAPEDVGGCGGSEIADGIRYAADNGAQVLNLSLGGSEPDDTVRDALTYAVGKGAFVAIAMGNAYEEGNPVNYPAAYAAAIPGVMSVGAVGPTLARSYYSSTGPHIEIAAPGGDDRQGGGKGMIWQTTIFRADSRPGFVMSPRFDRYAEAAYEGTSMAAPHVAGIAALMISHGVTKPSAVEAIIEKTARFLGAPDARTPGRNEEYGFGLIQPRAALHGVGVAK